MKIIEKIKKYRAEVKELETYSRAKCELMIALADIKNRLNVDVANHVGWTAGDYKWEYHLMEIAFDDARSKYENLMSVFGGELADAHRADIKNILDCFISTLTAKQVSLCSEATVKFLGNDITKI